MNTRNHTHEIELKAMPETVFAALHTPSAIRQWWSASQAIVFAQEGGVWSAAWGAEDDPDYVASFRIRIFEPPHRMVLTDYQYLAKSGALPFQADMMVTFSVEAQTNGCTLRVVQDGFPADQVADDFYAACEVGWQNTFEGIRRFFESKINLTTQADNTEPAPQQVTGIGGIFFKAQDAVKLRDWYKTHLGIKIESYGGTIFEWRDAINPERQGTTSWSIFTNDTRYLDPSDKPFMINYRVKNLDEILIYLRNENVEVDERIEDSEFGRFGWAMDIEGNRIELWQPAEGL
jgi:uncharacterized protein YndB with AHSA1/START domain